MRLIGGLVEDGFGKSVRPKIFQWGPNWGLYDSAFGNQVGRLKSEAETGSISQGLRAFSPTRH